MKKKKITILTLFPEMFDGFLTNSIIKRAIAKGIVEVKIVNIRDYTRDKYGRVDTPPIGGGAGLIMKCQPLADAIYANCVPGEFTHRILLSPRGERYTQKRAHELADYILTGGEIGAMAIADSIIRLLDGAISGESIVDESFENGLLEYPQYTEPYEWDGVKVPDILYSGNHGAIEKWRKKQSLRLTRAYRPDLFAKYKLSKQEKKLLDELDSNETPKWEKDAIDKAQRFIKKDENND